jgi:hypothetical protein
MLDILATSIAACRKLQLETRSIGLRLIRVELDSGETEVPITFQIDSEKYPHHLFAELYYDRWPIEEDYKVMKCRIGVGNFSGKSPLSVYRTFTPQCFQKTLPQCWSPRSVKEWRQQLPP